MSDNKKNVIYEKVLNIVLDILIFLFGIILLISIYNNIQIKVLKNDYSSFFGYSVFEVQTGSMAKEINAGDWIIVKYDKNIKLNDIITFSQDGEFITHRVVEAYKGTFVTKGDKNNTKDEAITREQIVGRVVKVLPYFGILRRTLFNPVVLIALIVTIYLANFAFKNKTKKDKVAGKNDKIMEKILIVVKNIFENIRQFVVSKVSSVKKTENKKQEVKEVKNEEIKVVKEEIKIINEEKEEQELPVEENYTINELKEEIPQLTEEDFDKTIHFRMVSVDRSDIENTSIIVDDEPEEEMEVVTEEKKEEFEQIVKENLEVLQKKRKKFKNILEKSMFIKSEEINEIFTVLMNNEKLKTNEATIKETFLKTYIDAKYYNYYGDTSITYNGKNMNSCLENAFKTLSLKMVEQYKGNDARYSDKVKKIHKTFSLIVSLEQAYAVLDDVKVRRETYQNKLLKYFSGEAITPQKLKDMINKIMKIQRLHNGMIKYCITKLETNMFEVKYNPLTIKNVYGLELEHNITFSKVYSDYIVDKTYSEGIIAEDKIAVLIQLLLVQIAKDMFNADFNKKYVLYLPESLYDKENKLYNVFEMIEDEYAKNSIIVLTQYDGLTKHKKIVKNFRKDGYHFAVDLGVSSKIKTKDLGIIELMDYVFVDNKNPEKDTIAPTDDIKNKVVYDDIANKVGNFWGE